MFHQGEQSLEQRLKKCFTKNVSARRTIIKTEVKENTIKNAEKMKVKKYGKRKRVTVQEFLVEGQNVAVKIPAIDRGQCDLNRIPCVIVYESEI